MRSSHKSRSRNKNNNNNNNRRSNPTNVVNRVFDSSGPEGKVRGTPQQIIDKYQSLASDAVLSGDRVNAENFLQHSEHYSRLLTEAQAEINARRDAQEAQRLQQQQNQQQNQQQQQQQQQKPAPNSNDAQPDVAGNAADLFPAKADNANLVETPENKAAPIKADKPVKAKKPEKKIEIKKPQAPAPEAPIAAKEVKEAPVAAKEAKEAPVAAKEAPDTAAE